MADGGALPSVDVDAIRMFKSELTTSSEVCLEEGCVLMRRDDQADATLPWSKVG